MTCKDQHFEGLCHPVLWTDENFNGKFAQFHGAFGVFPGEYRPKTLRGSIFRVLPQSQFLDPKPIVCGICCRRVFLFFFFLFFHLFYFVFFATFLRLHAHVGQQK